MVRKNLIFRRKSVGTDDPQIGSKFNHSENNGKWLVRTAYHQIFGPLSDQEIVQSMKQGKFKKGDEICPANGYWFHLNQIEELRKHFKSIKSVNFNVKGRCILLKWQEKIVWWVIIFSIGLIHFFLECESINQISFKRTCSWLKFKISNI